MDPAVKRSNKENSKPEAGPKKAASRDVISKVKPKRPAPLQSKNEAGGNTKSKAQVNPSKPAESKDSDPTRRKTLSQTFRTEQTLRLRKLVLETQKPPSSVPPKPLLPGTYKGRVVKSKIDCFRKPPSGREKNPSENKTKAGVQHSMSKSGAGVNAQKTIPQRQIHSRMPAQTATVSAKPSTVSAKPITVSAKPITVSAKPSTVSTKPSTVSTKPSTVSKKPSIASTKPITASTKPSVISRNKVMSSARPPTVTSFIKKKEPLKPAAAASEKKTQSSGSIRQYLICVKSVEERRLKLAEWLASKGKTLKRPAMTEKSAPQTCQPQLDAENEVQPEASERAETEQNEVLQREPAFSSSPSHILNITLDLLDNSDSEPPAEPEIRMESLVINLCERLEAMETPSSCRSQTKSEGNAEVTVEEETPQYAIVEEEEPSEEPKTTAVEKTEEEDGEEEKKMMEVKEKEEKKLFEYEDEEKMDSIATDVLDACVVKYSVKTTPFLRSVKKRMESEMAPGTPGSRRKGSIKELKFLTPVRRSSRIHRNLSRLPGMLNEHDPCVSSLAELELLDAADSNAYIYRKNPVLLQHLPDQHPEAQSAEHACK